MNSITGKLFDSGLHIIGQKEEHYVVHCEATVALCLHNSAPNCSEAWIANDRYFLVAAQVTAVTLPNNRGKFKLVRLSTEDNQIIHIEDDNVSPKLAFHPLEEVYMDADSPEGSDILSKVPNLPGFLNQSDDYTIIPVRIRQDSPVQYTAVVDYFAADHSDWPLTLLQSDTDYCTEDWQCDVGYESILTPETIIETSCKNFSSDLDLPTVKVSAMEGIECPMFQVENSPLKIDESVPPKPIKGRKYTGRKRRVIRKSKKRKSEKRRNSKKTERGSGDSEPILDENIWVASLCQSEEVTPTSSRNSPCSESYDLMTSDAIAPMPVERSRYEEMADAYQAKFQNQDGGCSLMILANVAAMSLEQMVDAEIVANYVEGNEVVIESSPVNENVLQVSSITEGSGGQQNIFPKRMKLTDHDPYRRRTRSSKVQEEKATETNTASFKIDCNSNSEW